MVQDRRQGGRVGVGQKGRLRRRVTGAPKRWPLANVQHAATAQGHDAALAVFPQPIVAQAQRGALMHVVCLLRLRTQKYSQKRRQLAHALPARTIGTYWKLPRSFSNDKAQATSEGPWYIQNDRLSL
jgi:hypothetical protein